MDRLEFVKSIEYEDFQKSIVGFFDENMALYNLVGEYQNINCITGNVNDKSITFDLKFNEIEDSEKMYSLMNGTSTCIYGHLYSIDCNLNNNTINIKLIDLNEGCRCN
jgi:hypothetical protein